MPYIVSSLTNSQTYTAFDKPELRENSIARPATPKFKVLVRGGANVMGQVHTPSGVVTKITDEEAEFLRTNDLFCLHSKNGLVKILANAPDGDVVAKDLRIDAGEVVAGERISGGSAPLSAERGDFELGGRAGGVAPTDVKTIV